MVLWGQVRNPGKRGRNDMELGQYVRGGHESKIHGCDSHDRCARGIKARCGYQLQLYILWVLPMHPSSCQRTPNKSAIGTGSTNIPFSGAASFACPFLSAMFPSWCSCYSNPRICTVKQERERESPKSSCIKAAVRANLPNRNSRERL